MYRKLVVFRSEVLTETSWYRRAEPPPIHPLPENIRLRWLEARELSGDACPIARPRRVLDKRLRDNGRCLAGFNVNTGETVYHLWVTTGGAYIDWIFRYLPAPATGALVYDVWADPRWRGGTVHKAGAALAAQEALQLGRTEIWAGVEEHEFFPFAAMYARAGIGIIDAQYFLVGLKLGPLRLHWRRPPPAKALEFSARLREHGVRGTQDRNADESLPV
jgi:hypothetical protein